MAYESKVFFSPNARNRWMARSSTVRGTIDGMVYMNMVATPYRSKWSKGEIRISESGIGVNRLFVLGRWVGNRLIRADVLTMDEFAGRMAGAIAKQPTQTQTKIRAALSRYIRR